MLREGQNDVAKCPTLVSLVFVYVRDGDPRHEHPSPRNRRSDGPPHMEERKACLQWHVMASSTLDELLSGCLCIYLA